MGSKSCPHLEKALSSLQPPRPSQQVHREECTLCFDNHDDPAGIDVCLQCFNGGCTGNTDRQHALLHFQKTDHSLVVNVKRQLKPSKQRDDTPPQPKRLAIEAETEADKYDYITTARCLACETEHPKTDKVQEVVNGIMNALSSAQQSEVKAWEEEIVACTHTRELKQLGESFVLEAAGLAKCGRCDLDSNLWLCLTCGNLGCGRAQFGGVGGNSHGLTHFEESGHPVSVKQGTITAEGTADIYCYACNDARLDPQLAKHLSHFGINVMDLSKTEKSMTELQLEQNLKFDFNMTGEDGKELQPVFGPGLTGLKNLGNSCYMASVLQSLFSLPQFHSRYMDAYRPHTTQCSNPLPATCLECQTTKVADGLLSGRYSIPRPRPPGKRNEDDEKGPIFQEGIRPSMFKALIGKGHEEFSTMRQQDADEFLKYLFSCLQKESKRLAADPIASASGSLTTDPTSAFSYGLQQRLQCLECKKVRYTVEAQDAGVSLPVPIRPIEGGKGKAPVEGTSVEDDTKAADVSGLPAKTEYEAVDLQECLDIFTAAETLDYRCPSCKKDVKATKRTLFTTFPDVLAVQVRRFQLINWVPTKVDVPIVVPIDASLSLDKYLGSGKREDEQELPEDSHQAPAAAPEFDAGAMSQLSSMGFPEIRCQRALLATGNTGDAESAMNWLFAHMEDPDIDAPIDWSTVNQNTSQAGGGGAAAAADTSTLEDMGFSRAQARKALRLNGNNAEIAVAWLFENPDDPGEEESAGETSAPSGVMGGNSTIPARYRLKAFISHKGPSVHSGHYVAHINKSPDWVFFNDEKVVEASSVDDISKLAYEYIFVRE